MTIERAIEVLAHSNEQLKQYIEFLKTLSAKISDNCSIDSYGSVEYCKQEYEAVQIAIDALKEKLAREQGCEYCNSLICYTGYNYREDGEVIHFCKFCGRRLEVKQV